MSCCSFADHEHIRGLDVQEICFGRSLLFERAKLVKRQINGRVSLTTPRTDDKFAILLHLPCSVYLFIRNNLTNGKSDRIIEKMGICRVEIGVFREKMKYYCNCSPTLKKAKYPGKSQSFIICLL